jgi:hypothetical protein
VPAGDANADTNGDADGNPHGDSYANCNGNTYSNRNTYNYSHCNTNGYAYADCDAKRMRFLTRVLEKPSRGVAGYRVAAWERHLYPGTIASDSARTSPWEWLTHPGQAGNRCQTEHRQRRRWKLHPANIGRC